MSRYASETSVPVDRSKAEIERTLHRYGATGFLYGTKHAKAMIAFEVEGRHVRIMLPLPTHSDDDIQKDGRGHRRNQVERERAIDQETRRRWRALALVIKAKLEAVTSGIALFDDEFLAYMVLPSGESFGDWARPQIDSLAAGGKMPPLLGTGKPQ
jgi:hypothetical protein